MFFTQAKPEYLAVTYLASRTAPLCATNQTTLTICSEIVTKIVTLKEVDECDCDQAVGSLLKDSELASFKHGGSVLELRQTYSNYEATEVSTLMRRAAKYEWDEAHRNVTYKKETEVSLVPSITILSIGAHRGKKRARE